MLNHLLQWTVAHFEGGKLLIFLCYTDSYKNYCLAISASGFFKKPSLHSLEQKP